jgi:FG-GAP-like repeat
MNTVAPSRPWLWAGSLGVLIAVAGAVAYLIVFSPRKVDPPALRPTDDPTDISDQVHNFCGGTCHKYPPADSFPRVAWRSEVERGYRFFEDAALPIKAPPIQSVVRYYEERAPEELPDAVFEKATRPLTLHFEKVSYPGPPNPKRFAVSNVNLVHLPDPTRPAPPATGHQPLDILACDMDAGLVMLLRPYEAKPAWKVLAKLDSPAHTEVIDLDGDGILDILVADLGSFPPTDGLCGKVIWLRGRPDGSFTPYTLLDKVGRVADVQAAKFCGSGKLDLVVGVFGWHKAGNVLLLENQTMDWDQPKFVPHVVDSRHGAIHVPVTDLNGDGKPDFVALLAQEYETVVAFINKGGGEFEEHELYSADHPGWGSSGIQLVDLNGDGKLDVLYTNGDILDEPYLFKPYHSVQWLENKGKLNFEYHPLTPMYGVHRAVGANFHGNGKKDIVAVSFLPAHRFPDRGKRKAAGIILLEQTEPGKFERHTLEEVDCDHVTCAAGDIYGTGKIDFVVGNFSAVSTDHPVTIWKNLGRPMTGLSRPRDRGDALTELRRPFADVLSLSWNLPEIRSNPRALREQGDSPDRGSGR